MAHMLEDFLVLGSDIWLGVSLCSDCRRVYLN